jgi:hypothetical protein
LGRFKRKNMTNPMKNPLEKLRMLAEGHLGSDLRAEDISCRTFRNVT